MTGEGEEWEGESGGGGWESSRRRRERRGCRGEEGESSTTTAAGGVFCLIADGRGTWEVEVEATGSSAR